MVHQTVESDKKINLNIHFFIIFFMICIAGLNDILIYTAHLDYSIGLIISSIINIIIFGNFIYRKKILLNSNFEKTDLILFIVWIIYSLTKIVFPDETYDTFSYHIYLQENPFIDKVNFDFFPGRIYCIFLFPLADRLHYIFRYLFGYRFGRIASFYTAIIVFYQLKNILFFLTKNKKMSMHT